MLSTSFEAEEAHSEASPGPIRKEKRFFLKIHEEIQAP